MMSRWSRVYRRGSTMRLNGDGQASGNARMMGRGACLRGHGRRTSLRWWQCGIETRGWSGPRGFVGRSVVGGEEDEKQS
jgi:hypothetical protein